jgi:hypothetical protein
MKWRSPKRRIIAATGDAASAAGRSDPPKRSALPRLVSLFGTVKVARRALFHVGVPLTCRRTLNPVAEIMPGRCTRRTSGPSQRWVRCYPVGGRGRCRVVSTARCLPTHGRYRSTDPTNSNITRHFIPNSRLQRPGSPTAHADFLNGLAASCSLRQSGRRKRPNLLRDNQDERARQSRWN